MMKAKKIASVPCYLAIEQLSNLPKDKSGHAKKRQVTEKQILANV